MNNKRKTRMICAIIIFVLGISAFAYYMKFDYRLVKQDGKYYFVFNNPDKWNVRYPFEGFDNMSTPEPLSYPTGKELISAIKLGNLTDDDKYKIARFGADDSGRIEMFDFDNFYEPVLPTGWEATCLEWGARNYYYTLKKSDYYGKMSFYYDDLFDKEFQFYWYEYFEQKATQGVRTETFDNGYREEIYYTINYRPEYPEHAEEFKMARSFLSDGDKKLYVMREYRMPSEELITLKAYVFDGNRKYVVDFSGEQTDFISDETFLQFGIERIVVTLPWIGIGAFFAISISGIAFVTYKKSNKKKEAEGMEVMKCYTSNITIKGNTEGGQ